jgi:RNA polymerase sigma factor (TIGR02999 family)
MSEVTQLLREWSGGKQEARDELLGLVYEPLRAIAGRHLNREREGHTLQPTALVHELYLKLVDQRRVAWNDRAHFFAVAAQVMRRILVDHARRRNLKRGAGVAHVPIDEAAGIDAALLADMTDLDAALHALARVDARKARVVEMRFFAGLTVEEIASVLQVSPVTVMRDWRAAKAWLYRELAGGDGDGS